MFFRLLFGLDLSDELDDVFLGDFRSVAFDHPIFGGDDAPGESGAT